MFFLITGIITHLFIEKIYACVCVRLCACACVRACVTDQVIDARVFIHTSAPHCMSVHCRRDTVAKSPGARAGVPARVPLLQGVDRPGQDTEPHLQELEVTRCLVDWLVTSLGMIFI